MCWGNRTDRRGPTGYRGGVNTPDRTLLLMRHAKSDYPDGVADHERPLAPRGIREAGLAGDWIRAHAPAVDAVLCSTATRTRETLARTRIDAPTEFVERLYDSSPGTTLDVINGLRTTFDFDVSTLLVVGHEPTTSELALGLTANGDQEAIEAMVLKYPTSAIAMLRTSEPWEQLQLRGATLVAFHVPR
jgi:phosphohistidine phosphatase